MLTTDAESSEPDDGEELLCNDESTTDCSHCKIHEELEVHRTPKGQFVVLRVE